MRAGHWLGLILAALLLAGCSELPVSGSVQVGSTEGPNDTTIVYQPSPPAPGASQEEIVTGFLAAASAGGDFHVAKEYLAPAFAEKWRPRNRVLLQAAQPNITTTSKTDLVATVPIAAKVNVDGVYTPSTQPVPLPFHLVQLGGQWRIDFAQNGIVLGQPVFQKIYVPQSLEFFDPTWTRLVPDLRWFPTSSNRRPLPTLTSVVTALIKGPAGAIASGVTVNALRGATLAGIDAGNGDVTTVVLTVKGAEPSADALARMQQQLIKSLRRPTPAALRLQVNGVVAPQVKALINQPGSLLPYVVADGKFGPMAVGGAVTEDRTLGKRIAELQPQNVTVSVRQGLAAVLSRAGDVAIVTAEGARPVPVPSRSQLIAPTLDQRNWVYSVPKESPSDLRATNPKGRTVDLGGTLGGSTVNAIEVSPDGTRMLVFIQSATGPEAYVAGIERSEDGTPTGLTAAHYPVDLGGNTGQGLGATWVDDGDVAVLVSAPDNSTDRVRIQQLGGFGSPLEQLTNAVSIVGTSDQSDLRVRLSTGDLFVWRGTVNAWQSESGAGVDVSVLAVQR